MAKGIQKMTVVKIEEECKDIKSFYLKAEEPLPRYKAGQFIAIRVMIDGKPYPRRYSLSGPLGADTYRLTIKREEHGTVSKYFYDEIKVGDTFDARLPMGDFVLDEDKAQPIVFISGGIGITPIFAMMQEAVAENRTFTFVNAVRNHEEVAFQDEIDALKSKHPFDQYTFFSRPTVEDEDMYDVKGRINKAWIEENLPLDATYYFCGPIPFMETIEQALLELDVTENRIHYEAFK